MFSKQAGVIRRDGPSANFTLRGPRFSVNVRTRLTSFGNGATEVVLQNISPNGFFGVSGQALPIGSTVVVELPNLGSAPAQVRWALGTRFGAAFLKEFKLDEARIADLTQQDYIRPHAPPAEMRRDDCGPATEQSDRR